MPNSWNFMNDINREKREMKKAKHANERNRITANEMNFSFDMGPPENDRHVKSEKKLIYSIKNCLAFMSNRFSTIFPNMYRSYA